MSKIDDLVNDFHKADLKQVGYKEDWARSDYIEPLFKLLGWSRLKASELTNQSTGYIRQSTQQVEGTLKEPDYGFYVDGALRFFVEAKKPAVNLAKDKGPAFQLRRYSWNARHPIGITTNFRELCVYGTRRQPEPTDGARVGRIEYLTCDEFADRWEWLEAHLALGAVRFGSLERLEGEAATAKKTKPVDSAFLNDMEDWRSILAEEIHFQNPSLSTRTLNMSVQTLIDRLVFLRIAEARGLEDAGELEGIANQPSELYQSLVGVFNKADKRYNSGLFHFRNEAGRGKPDTITPSLTIRDAALRRVLRRLVPSETPYDFRALPVEILGHAYERFLGNVIEVGNNNDIIVSPKPWVKKANGIYYTPKFVVDYIVRSTLNALLQNKSVPEAEQIRIVDPACGSGSFLIAAYDYLLDWHLVRYLKNPKYKSRITAPSGSVPRLTTNARKAILINNIFGVDLDEQAVEVAKLSLLLKVVEGEAQLSFNIELPDLDRNIRRGNALFDTDYFATTGAPATEAGVYEVAPFHWPDEFPMVFQGDDPGFDAVIGNPPYYSVDATWGKSDTRLKYLKSAYPEVYNDKTDILFYFIKRALDISRGEVGLIVSRAFLEAFKADKLRAWITQTAGVREILDFRNAVVFPGVGITTAVVRLTKRPIRTRVVMRRLVTNELPLGITADRLGDERLFRSIETTQSNFGSRPWTFGDEDVMAIVKKLDKAGTAVRDMLHIGQGMQTGANTVFASLPQSLVDELLGEDLLYLRATNTDIRRWVIEDRKDYILYLEDYEHFNDLPNPVQNYLNSCAAQLMSRKAYERGDCQWWQYTWPLHKEYFSGEKIFCPYLAGENRFAIDADQTFLGLTDTTVLYSDKEVEDLRYIAGLLNSQLLTFRLWHSAKLKSNGIREYFANAVGLLPIVRLKATDSRYKDVLGQVDKATSAARERMNSGSPAFRKTKQLTIQAAEEEIDKIVMNIYGLTDREAEVVYETLSNS
jgi:hypothetical protein